jgi:hypothetical protein
VRRTLGKAAGPRAQYIGPTSNGNRVRAAAPECWEIRMDLAAFAFAVHGIFAVERTPSSADDQ